MSGQPGVYSPAPPQQQQQQHYPYSHPPPSPPAEDNSKCSLPPISNLLGLAGGPLKQEPQSSHGSSPQASSPVQSRAEASGPYSPPHQHSPPTMKSEQTGSPQAHTPPQQYPPTSSAPAQPQSQSPMQYQSGPSMVPQPMGQQPHRVNMPPTPPMSGDGFDQYTTSPGIKQQSSYYHENTPPLEEQRHHGARSMSYPNSYQQAPYSAQSPVGQYYASSPGGAPQQQAVSPQMHNGMYYQRPLPGAGFPFSPVASSPNGQHFQPPQHGVSLVQPGPAIPASTWTHSYVTPPAQPMTQNQDRYVCQTCHKAFSRPSSLRIHSHSHTGEKPFKCPHEGCGKAFSVRSNMKRHERGCHNYDSRTRSPLAP